MAHRDRPLPPLPDAIPADVDALVAGLTAKNPAARPAAIEVAHRAGSLRDALAAGATISLTRTPSPPVTLAAVRPETLADAQPAAVMDAQPGTLADVPFPPWPPPERPFHGRSGLSRTTLALAAALAVALLGILLAGVLGSAPTRPSARPPARPSPAATARMVEVNAGALVGQPVSAVARHLHQLGLVVSVRWVPANQPPATVVSVQPSGRVPMGSRVVVTGAYQPPPKAKSPGKHKTPPAAPKAPAPPKHQP